VITALRRAILEIKQRWSIIDWVTKNVLSRAPWCFGKHAKPLVPAAFANVSTHQPELGPRGGLWLLIRKACSPAQDINKLMMMKKNVFIYTDYHGYISAWY
jgi:hypothetical protein